MPYRNKGDSEKGFKGVFERRVKNAQMVVVMLIIAIAMGWPAIIGAVIAYSLKSNSYPAVVGAILALVLGEVALIHLVTKANRRYNMAEKEFKKNFPQAKPTKTTPTPRRNSKHGRP